MEKFNYNNLIKKIAILKKEITITDYFNYLVNQKILTPPITYGKQIFYGWPEQKTGSIAIEPKENVFFDHREGIGGDLIKACQFFENKSFTDAIKHLSNFDIKYINNVNNVNNINNINDVNQQSKYIITHVFNDIKNTSLIKYIESRGLTLLDMPNTKEVHWNFNDKKYFAIGIKNIKGGWILRNAMFKGILGSNAAAFMTINNFPKSVRIFEGYFDFASFYHINKEKSFIAVILNTTSNLTTKLIDSVVSMNKNIDKSEGIFTYFDNDIAGDKATKKIADLIKISDERNLYTNYKDLNEWLISHTNSYSRKF